MAAGEQLVFKNPFKNLIPISFILLYYCYINIYLYDIDYIDYVGFGYCAVIFGYFD
jgi:hypothetical protein